MLSQNRETATLHDLTKHLPLADRIAAGKALRDKVSRRSHGSWQPASDRPDPIALLELSGQGRLTHLLPIRYERMLTSPFAFLRGSAIVMAADLAAAPATGIKVQACGDCHLLNFGGYATPERNLVFDLNDFDETLPAPWEWDIKRLAASVVVAGRHINLAAKSCQAAAREAVCSYRERLGEYAQMGALELWYARIDAKSLLDLAHASNDPKQAKLVEQTVKKALKRTSESVIPKLTEVVNGQRRIVDNPPLIYHLPSDDSLGLEFEAVIQQYRQSVREDLQVLLDRYRLVDVAMKVVGVGSVGTRCAIALMVSSQNDYVFLQIKEALPSVLAPYAGKSAYQNQGQRVVVGQRIVQAASDLFLGWTHHQTGHDFYVRQLRDMKVSLTIEGMTGSELTRYARTCGWALALAHACSGDAALLSGYLGKKDVFDQAIAQFAVAYADQTEKDHAALAAAVKVGRLPIQVVPTVG